MSDGWAMLLHILMCRGNKDEGIGRKWWWRWPSEVEQCSPVISMDWPGNHCLLCLLWSLFSLILISEVKRTMEVGFRFIFISAAVSVQALNWDSGIICAIAVAIWNKKYLLKNRFMFNHILFHRYFVYDLFVYEGGVESSCDTAYIAACLLNACLCDDAPDGLAGTHAAIS